MIEVRKSDERGHLNHGWLDTYHSFSFGDYYDPAHMGFRTLRVINEDRVEPENGFGMHPHRDMEIVTYVVAGALTHKDSMGTGSTIRPGDVQRMSAGRGILHSEMNESDTDAVHLLQIWILPEKKGGEPEYEQKTFPEEDKENRLRLIASPDGRDGSVTVHQDVLLFDGKIEKDKSLAYDFAAERFGWVQLIRGEIELNGNRLTAGDGASLASETRISIKAAADAGLLLFDLG